MKIFSIILISTITLAALGCGNYESNNHSKRKVVNDSAVVRHFTVNVEGEKYEVLATKDINHVAYYAYNAKKDYIDKNIDYAKQTYSSFRVIDYKGSDAQYSLLIPDNYGTSYKWFLTCPFQDYNNGLCIISGKVGSYVFDVDLLSNNIFNFNKIVSSILDKDNQMKLRAK